MKYNINLLPQREQNFLDRIIFFSFHYLRYILVLTQLVVILVFFTRLKVDQEIIDKKDSLMQKQEIVSVSQPLLKQAEAIDSKISQVDAVLVRQDNLQAMTNYFLANFPKGLVIDKLSITDNAISLTGVTTEPQLVQAFYQRLQAEKRFKKINLSELQKTESGFDFSFSLQDFVSKEKI